jgi:hypothetical protein
MIDFLFDNPKTEYLLIDEVDKINKRDQTVLYNVMETGILSETKSSHTNVGSRQQKMKLRIFATANELEKLQKPFRSRFMEFYLPEYNLQEFLEITKRLLYSRYKLSQEIAVAIANVVWNDIKTKDIRDVLQIAKLARNIDDVQDVARTLIKYRPKPKAADDKFNAEAMRSAMPNAVFFAFSGTPIDKKNRSTYKVFGPLLDKYSFEESKQDGATLKILYEDRMPDLYVEGEEDSIDHIFERVFSDLDDDTKQRLKKEYVTKEKILEAPARVKKYVLIS